MSFSSSLPKRNVSLHPPPFFLGVMHRFVFVVVHICSSSLPCILSVSTFLLCTLLVVPLLNALRPTKGTVTYILQKIYEFRVINFWEKKILMSAVERIFLKMLLYVTSFHAHDLSLSLSTRLV